MKNNVEAIRIYIDGARDALESAQYNQKGGYYGLTVNRGYYAFFYGASAVLFTLDITRSKHSGILAAFREQFVKTGFFSVQDSNAYGEAFELRNISDDEMLGDVGQDQASITIENAKGFIDRCVLYLKQEGHI
ncbi:MAG: HEPN domain-containing protein [Anaerolineales bacterium]|nr:HEPN domain-containing protein [Chloroflexota bacterium]MBL6981351.1 HEPN domain-containing protein [Anaerolineales bacterium]